MKTGVVHLALVVRCDGCAQGINRLNLRDKLAARQTGFTLEFV